MALKRWAVRQIAGLLSDYLEGVSEQNLQASLSLAVGEVEIRHVRVQPGLLSERHLELLSSDVSVSARIPWRNLGSEPTVFTVHDVWVEARRELPATSLSGAQAEEALERWRDRRARAVTRGVEAGLAACSTPEAADTGSGQRRSIATRLGHAALRQLQVRVEGLQLRLHPEDEAHAPLDLCCRRLALDEGSTTRGTERSEAESGSSGALADVPDEVRQHPASLNKVFSLEGLSISLGPPAAAAAEAAVAAQAAATVASGGAGDVHGAESTWPSDWQSLRNLLAECQGELASARVNTSGTGGAGLAESRLLKVKRRLQYNMPQALPVAGPLSLGARLWHSAAAGLLWLSLELQVSAASAVASLSPEVARYARAGFDWYLAVLAAPPGISERCNTVSGHSSSHAAPDGSATNAADDANLASEYIELYTQGRAGEPPDQERIREIEDIVSVDSLIRWRLRCHDQLNSGSSSGNPVGVASAAVPKSPEGGVLGWIKRRWRGRGPARQVTSRSGSSTSSEDSSDDSEEPDEVSDEEGIMEGILPEVEEPQRVEVVCVIPLCDIVRCRLDASSGSSGTSACALRVVGGVRCRGAIVSAGTGSGAWLLRTWDADVNADLLSLAMMLDSEPLMLLQRESGDGGASSDDDEFHDALEESDEEEGQAEPGKRSPAGRSLASSAVPAPAGMVPAVCCALACTHRGGNVSGSVPTPRWSIRVRLRQEPFRFALNPWSLRSALDIVVSVFNGARPVQAPLLDGSATPSDTPVTIMQARSEGTSARRNDVTSVDTAAQSATEEAPKTADVVALDLDLDMAAPVLRWGLAPQGQLIVSLGRVLFRTCGVVPPPAQPAEPELCMWQSFACNCQLTATSVAVQLEDAECQVYEPSSIGVRAWREADGRCLQLSIDTDTLQWTATPAVLRAFGQMPLGLDYALTPLRDVLAKVLSRPVPTMQRQSSGGSVESEAEAEAVAAGEVYELQGPEEMLEEIPQLQVHVKLRCCKLMWGPPGMPSHTAMLLEDIEVDYAAGRENVDYLGQVGSYEIAYECLSVVDSPNGGSFKVRNTDRHLALNVQSGVITVQWHELQIRGVIATMHEAWGSLKAGQDCAQDLLLVGESAGMSAQLWKRFVNERISTRLQYQATSRLAELLPGLEHQMSDGMAADAGGLDRSSGGSVADAIPEARSDCSVEVALCCEGVMANFLAANEEIIEPAVQFKVTGAECVVRGFRSGDGTADISLLNAELALRGRRLLTPRRAGKLLQVRIVRLIVPQPVVHWTASWAQVCILFRQRDYDFLRGFLQTTVFNVLSELRRTESSRTEPRRARTSSAPAKDVPARYFRLDVGAPRVFLPTDKALLKCRTRRGSTIDGGGGELQIATSSGEPEFWPAHGEGVMVFDFGHVTALRSSGSAALGGIDLRFRGAHILGIAASNTPDIWNASASRSDLSSEASASEDNLAEASSDGSPTSSQAPGSSNNLRELLSPVNVNAVLKTGGPLEFHMKSIAVNTASTSAKDSSSGNMAVTAASSKVNPAADVIARSGSSQDATNLVDHRMSLTRAQLTLLFDVIAENICYTGRIAKMAPAKAAVSTASAAAAAYAAYAAAAVSAPANDSRTIGESRSNETREMRSETRSGEWVRQAVEAAAGPGRGFKFSWQWPGDLVLDMSYTDAVPLVRLCLAGGLFSIESSSARSIYRVCCSSLSADDLRPTSRNANRSLLACAEPPDGGYGFEVRSENPEHGDAKTVVRLVHPVMQVLPQLIMDLVTAGMSGWQQCTFSRENRANQELAARGAGAMSGAESAKAADTTRCHRVEVNLVNGSFRVAGKWSEPMDYFEFLGSLLIALVIHSEGISTERADLTGGCLRYRSAVRHDPSTLIPCLEWTVKAEHTRVDDNKRMSRHSTIILQPVVIRPYAVRVSLNDHRAMVKAFLELLSFDCDPSEPPEELAGRDPLAQQVVESRFTIQASIEIQGAEVQVLHEEGGHAWPGMKANLKCREFEVTVELRPGIAATVNLFTKEVELEVWAHNHRLDCWEPVVPECRWHLSYHQQRKPDGGPRDVLQHSCLRASAPVALLVSAPTVHLARRIFSERASDMRYGHLLTGLNVSGVSFRITSEHSEECILEAQPCMKPLDWLLKGRSRAGQPPWLTLTILNQPGARVLMLPLGREGCTLWDTGTVGLLVCRLIMPRPPQRILLVSSTVCVWNRTPTDLEVRFLAPIPEESGKVRPVPPERPCYSVDANILSSATVGMNATPAGADTGSSSSAARANSPTRHPDSSSGNAAARLSAGQMLSVPPEMQQKAGNVIMQVRPALEATGGIAFEWCSPFRSLVTAPTEQEGPISELSLTTCSAPPADLRNDLPGHWLHLRVGAVTDESRCDVEIHAPFTIVNACPCDVLCWLNPTLDQKVGKVHLGTQRDACSGELVVRNGRGDEVHVPAGGQADIFPLVLDSQGYFYYTSNGRQEKAKPRKPETNGITAVYERGQVEWRFFHAEIGKHQSVPLRVNAQSVLPVFDIGDDELGLSFALRDSAGTMTSWSLPLHVVAAATQPIEEVVSMVYKGMPVLLNTYRQRRELVVYSRCWFVNSCGMDDLELLQPEESGGPGQMHPVPFFGDRVAFLPEFRNEAGDGVLFIRKKGNRPICARVPDVGGDEAVSLTQLHRCCLRTERVALAQSGGDPRLGRVPCRLVSLLPAMLLFNRMDSEIGFRQAGSKDATAVWIAPGKSSMFWWAETANQKLQVCLRSVTAETPHSVVTSWSSPFEVAEAHIGSFPVILDYGVMDRRLVCICIDQDVRIFSVAVRGEDACHMLVNQHPSLQLDAFMEGTGTDPKSHFCVSYGSHVAFAGKGPLQQSSRRLHLRLDNTANPEERVAVGVQLNRSGQWSVPIAGDTRGRGGAAGGKGSGAAPQKNTSLKSTLRVPAHVTVELRNRVAIVTVSRGLVKQDSNSCEKQGELQLSHLTVAVLTEGMLPSAAAPSGWIASLGAAQRREAFTVCLSGVSVQVKQPPSRQRQVDFKIKDAKVVLQPSAQAPKGDVVLANTTRPFLQTHSHRDDVAMLDVHVRAVDLVFGELEVSVTDAVWDQARLLAHNFAPDAGGMSFRDVSARAAIPYHCSCLEPPPASSKLVLSRLDVGPLKVSAWCRIYLPDAHYIPKTLRDTIQYMNFGTPRLDVSGAQVKVPEQRLFHEAHAEGSLSAVLSRVWDHYFPHVKASWRSLLQNSNVLLGGFLAPRHFWAPRERKNSDLEPSVCHVGPSGELSLRSASAAAAARS